MAKKLYEARVEVVIYLLAEEGNEDFEGVDALEETVRDNGLTECPWEVREVTHKDWPLDSNWSRKNLVYGTDTDTPLGDVLDTLPEKEAVKP